MVVARNALEGALKKTSKSKQPLQWASFQNSFGVVLIEIGEREKDEGLLQQAVRALQGALAVSQAHESENQKFTWSNLGNALQTLGELTLDVDVLKRVIDAQENTLDLKGRERDVLDRVLTENNLGLAQRWLGAVSGVQKCWKQRAPAIKLVNMSICRVMRVSIGRVSSRTLTT